MQDTCGYHYGGEDYVFVQLRRGDTIRFEAEVNMYHKGTKRRRRLDYGLCKPTDVQCVEQVLEQEA